LFNYFQDLDFLFINAIKTSLIRQSLIAIEKELLTIVNS